MGKKYDRYVAAVENNNAAKGQLAAASGGSSREGMQQAQETAKNAQLTEDAAWHMVLKDPEG